jgi:hypothetical protein
MTEKFQKYIKLQITLGKNIYICDLFYVEVDDRLFKTLDNLRRIFNRCIKLTKKFKMSARRAEKFEKTPWIQGEFLDYKFYQERKPI